jgi:hypothetical protein
MDTFFNDEPLLEKLKHHYTKNGRIIIAYDFDDTVAPTYMSKSCDDVIKILKDMRPYASFICFTSNERPEKAKSYLKEKDIPCDAFNDNVDWMMERYGHMRKVYFHILLDDKAGLGQAYRILNKFLEWLKSNSQDVSIN